MKTKLSSLLGLAGAVVFTTVATPRALASGDQVCKEKSYTGTIASVDANNNIVTVRGYFFNKHFVLANHCKLETPDMSSASLNDLRPGEKVAVRYLDASGVLVADQIKAEQMHFSGTVQAIDAQNHSLTVHNRGMNHTFTIADNCQVLGNGNAKESLNNIQWGDRVNVLYELPGDHRVARQIDLPGKVFTGQLDTINPADHSVTAGKDQKFFIGENCVIIANGNYNARMSDLRRGQNYQLNYETVGGVNVVNRIALAPAEGSAKAAEPVHTAQTMPPL